MRQKDYGSRILKRGNYTVPSSPFDVNHSVSCAPLHVDSRDGSREVTMPVSIRRRMRAGIEMVFVTCYDVERTVYVTNDERRKLFDAIDLVVRSYEKAQIAAGAVGQVSK